MSSRVKRLLPYVLLWYFLGSSYLVIEGLWRGWTHISMMAVGGICGLGIGAINQTPRFYNTRIVWQSLIGTAIVLVVEFAAGCVLNLWLGWGIWDYSNQPGNIMGQVCLLYAGLWFCLMPFAIWAEDKFRWMLYAYFKAKGESYPEPQFEDYTLRSIYRDLITGR